MNDKAKIIYTKTDEAPALATASLFPIVNAFTSAADICVETMDISLAGRIIAAFPENLSGEQKQSDDLARLGEMVSKSDTNIIKLPNISASIPQIKAAIAELQSKGFDIPNFPDEINSDGDRETRSRYDRIKGSAVNPVLREGNSDRRAPDAVKSYAKKNPHPMGAWSKDSLSRVSSMSEGDFYSTEVSTIIEKPCTAKIQLKTNSNEIVVLKETLPLIEGEIIDAAVLSAKSLREFFKAQIEASKADGTLFSVHLKATMMKVSDPIIFGHAVSAYFEDLFDLYGDTFAKLGISPDNGMGDLLLKVATLPEETQKEILAKIDTILDIQPDMAMVNSEKGISNLHVPSDIIIDASMPAAIRNSGQMWGPKGEARDTNFLIPDRSYAGIYDETISFCKEHGAFDPSTMGSVSNVGLMAQKAEEYGSHDKTFKIPRAGSVQIIDEAGTVLLERDVEEGDIFRSCQVKDAPIQNWIDLGVKRAKETMSPTIFWLDDKRAHDSAVKSKVKVALKSYDLTGLDIRILSPIEAVRVSLQLVKEGKNSVSVTGNVLRDYLTDLFPILEVGTSAKMLSIVPLMNGGGLFETGAGGSAPKLVQQFREEGYLAWDSLGEFLAIAASLDHLGKTFDNPKAVILGKALNQASAKLLDNDKSPTVEVGPLDNRGSHFFLTLYWAEALASQNENMELKERFKPLFETLANQRAEIEAQIAESIGKIVELGGYYIPNPDLLASAMCPSSLFREALRSL